VIAVPRKSPGPARQARRGPPAPAPRCGPAPSRSRPQGTLPGLV